ncbi:unnamed protein product [Penicillium salamii]|nr:unnamed protein product [Penicillium salamii]CAG8351236.1 unnamed protein product [Penicillium salamii]CAG8354191.1 unnamed protein product [Penicillium salamii]
MARHGKFKARTRRAPVVKDPTPKFTMQQEARNTETHGRSWSDSNLRHKAVLFVSAGSLEPTKEEDEQIKSDSDPEEPTPDEAEGQTGESDSLFFLDSTKQEIDTGLPDPVIQTKLSDSDDSSEDEVVFTGRRKTAKPVIVETHQTEIEKFVHNTPSPLQTAQGPVPVPREPSPPVVQVEHTHTESHPESPTWPPKQHIDPIADYIANIDKDYYEELTGMKLASDDDIDVEKAATQLDLSAASPAGSKRRSSRSLDAGQNAPSDNITTSVDGGILNYLRRLRKLLTSTSSAGLAQMQIDTEHDSISASSEDDEDDEDLVFSDSDDDAIEDFILLEDLAKGYSKSGKKGTRSGKPAFPSASAFADALEADPYFGFDIMDFDRPSLRNKPKGKHAIPELELSDSEFEIELQQAWQNDRTKKKLRKKEREELRAQGMLGRKAGNPDLKVKYSKEMNMEEFMTELRSFLLSSKNSLPLPPMTKERRKLIHEVANNLNLKSQSRGHGLSRFPVLNKTARTPRYTPKTISNVDGLLSGKKFNRRMFKAWGADAPKSFKTSRGKSGAASYMDGDVVGASAPEIGADNRGRAMLEKMGWSTGTALGAADNKGILQPVAQVVKNSRAGLG